MIILGPDKGLFIRTICDGDLINELWGHTTLIVGNRSIQDIEVTQFDEY